MVSIKDTFSLISGSKLAILVFVDPVDQPKFLHFSSFIFLRIVFAPAYAIDNGSGSNVEAVVFFSKISSLGTTSICLRLYFFVNLK